MDGEGIPKVEALLNRVMLAMGKQGAVAKNNSGEYLFKVTVPSIEDTSAQTGLTVDDYINRTLRNVKIDYNKHRNRKNWSYIGLAWRTIGSIGGRKWEIIF